ncbi:hypothetical protein NDU88_010623 [Pleurodeles waltl]|uniref:Uncharacterized protein n=1 Tax=Pleurodeles waltl TaxID=8319 RepID=A0AAV7PVE8_PLEWA|nr:hypothetical protein NDU88_010623 [Pleurodeles waltl]
MRLEPAPKTGPRPSSQAPAFWGTALLSATRPQEARGTALRPNVPTSNTQRQTDPRLKQLPVEFLEEARHSHAPAQEGTALVSATRPGAKSGAATHPQRACERISARKHSLARGTAHRARRDPGHKKHCLRVGGQDRAPSPRGTALFSATRPRAPPRAVDTPTVCRPSAQGTGVSGLQEQSREGEAAPK